MTNWNLENADGTMVLHLQEDDATGAMQGVIAHDGTSYNVRGGWSASGSVPGRTASVFSVAGSDGAAAPTWLAASGVMTGPGSAPQRIDLRVTTASSPDGTLERYSEELTPSQGSGPGWAPDTGFARLVATAGFLYDPDQDIIYSRQDATQRNFGFAYEFDALALEGLNADLDCEPIFFEYNNKLWMIELWKGQYGVETGGEIGVYNRPATGAPAYYALLDAAVGTRPIDPVAWHGSFFQSVGDDEMLDMTFTLSRKGEPLFTRPLQRHWWLTGFKWGVDSKPSDLVMHASITFPTAGMQAAVVQAMQSMGYAVTQAGLTITFDFAAPRAPQPPRDPALLAQVRAANTAIVARYDAFGLANNDPNQTPAAAVNAIASEILGRAPEHFGAILVEALKRAGHKIEELGSLLIADLGFAVEAVASWVTGAAATLETWIASIYNFLHDAFTFNFSTAVEVVNVESNGVSPSLLTLTGSNILAGSWFVQPPASILPGTTARFYLKDNWGFAGAEGWVDYAYVDASGTPHTVRFSFGCPFSMRPNYASQTPGSAFSIYGGSGSSPSWQPGIPATGHPLQVAYVWGTGKPV